MSDQVSPDLKEVTTASGPDSKPSRWDFLRKIHIPWRKSSNKTGVFPENPIGPTIETDTPSRQTGIGEHFLENITNKNLTVADQEFERVGVQALEGTNERGSPVLFEKLRNREQAPNGYLIGIGAGNVFSMLESFPKGTTPKAVILFDIDPAVVEFGQYLIQVLKDSPDQLPSVIKQKATGNIFYPNYNASPEQAILKYAGLLHQLAKEGNFIIARADFNNPQLIQELLDLPDFKSLNNVIYLSNIADHLWRRQASANQSYLPDFSSLNDLQSDPPHQNYFIDTLQVPLDYNLRIGTKAPVFKAGDFSSWFMNRWQTEPADLIDEQGENVVWEDIPQWDLDRILKANHALRSNPRYQEISLYVEEYLTQMRQSKLSRYPNLKQASTTDHTINIPQTLEEESALLAELAQPYSCERDLIPFIAHFVWQDAVDPILIDRNQIPKRKDRVLDPSTNKNIRIEDPRNWTKGQIEAWWLTGGISYEHLAAAKIYRELEKRLKEKNPAAETKGKTWEEITQELTET